LRYHEEVTPPTQPPNTDADARMAADIARLQAARGVNLRGWFRENKVLVAVFACYLALVGAGTTFAWLQGHEIGPALLFFVFFTPLGALRIYVRLRRR
jgi:hypothetical protein